MALAVRDDREAPVYDVCRSILYLKRSPSTDLYEVRRINVEQDVKRLFIIRLVYVNRVPGERLRSAILGARKFKFECVEPLAVGLIIALTSPVVDDP